MSCRQACTAPSTAELALSADDLRLKRQKVATRDAHNTVLPVDDATYLGDIEYPSSRRRIRRDGLDAIDQLRQRQTPVLQALDELDTELDLPLSGHVLLWVRRLPKR